MKHYVPCARIVAFTLLEIMLVVVIIALLAGAAIHFLSGHIEYAEEVKAKADIDGFTAQLLIYRSRNGNLPTTEQGVTALYEMPTTEPKPRNWQPLLTKPPIDPWNNLYVLEVPARRSRAAYDLYSKGRDGLAGTADDIGNW